MARIPQGILGGGSGKVGPTVMSSWKGIPVLKAMPLSVANPKTAAQTTQRGYFSTASKWGSDLLSTIVKPLWDRFAQKESGYNAWVKANLPAISHTPAVIYADLIMSNGTLAGFLNPAIATTEDAQLDFTWDLNTTGDFFASDQLYLAVYNPAKGAWATSSAAAIRSAESYDMLVPTAWSGDTVYMYGSWKKADGTKVSDSYYFGSTSVQ